MAYTGFWRGGGGLAHRESGSHWLLNRTATVNCHPCFQLAPLTLCTQLGQQIFDLAISLQYFMLVLQTVIFTVSFTGASQCKMLKYYMIFSSIKQVFRLGGCFVLVSRTIFKFTSLGGTNFQFRKFQEISLWH